MEEDFNIEEIEEEPSIFRKIIVILMAIFLILLLTSFILTDGNVRNSLLGLIESETINQNVIPINNGNNLIFTSNTYKNLLEIYDANLEVEFKVCLQGNIINGDYLIEEILVPETFLQTHSKVVAEPCPIETIVDMHSHPIRRCLPSDQDFNNFRNFKERNANVLLAVMCERERFNIYI